jgi:cell division protein FtsA
VGGKNVTNDIAIGLRTPVEQAEEIKKSYGCALSTLVDSDETINVPGVAGREPKEISRSVLAAIIEPRAEETFSLVLREMKKTNYSDLLGAGVVLTGGGSLMQGMVELAEQIFDMPAKKGVPQGFTGMVEVASTPLHSTGVGLILYGLEQMKDERSKGGVQDKGWFRRMKKLFSQYF